MLALIMLINRCGAMVIPFLGVYMTQELHFTLKETGIVLSFFGFGAVSGSLLGGWLTDQKGHFIVQLVSLTITVPIFIILPQLTSVEALAAGIFTVSLVSETFRPANSVSIMYYAKQENITKAFSLNRMALNLGFSIGPALGGFLAIISYSWLFYGNALSVTIAGVLFYFYFRGRATVPNKTVKEHVKPQKLPFKERVYGDFPFMLFSILSCLYGICFFQLLSTLPIFYREVHALSETNIGLLLGFSGLIVVLLEMALVHLAEKKLTITQAVFIGTLLCGLAYAILPFSKGHHCVLYMGMFILSISEILAMPFMATVAVKRSESRNKGAYMGFNALAFSAAHIVAPYLGTGIAQQYGFSTLWFSIGILALLTSFGIFWVLKRMKGMN